MRQVTVGDTLYVACESFVTNLGGVDIVVTQDQTRVREGHELIVRYPQLFKPITAHYEVEQATSAPGERRA